MISARRTLATCFGLAILVFALVTILTGASVQITFGFAIPMIITFFAAWYSLDFSFVESYWVERSSAPEEEKKILSDRCYFLFVATLGVVVLGFFTAIFWGNRAVYYSGMSSGSDEFYHYRDLVCNQFMAYIFSSLVPFPIIVAHFIHKSLVSNFWIRQGYRGGR